MDGKNVTVCWCQHEYPLESEPLHRHTEYPHGFKLRPQSGIIPTIVRDGCLNIRSFPLWRIDPNRLAIGTCFPHGPLQAARFFLQFGQQPLLPCLPLYPLCFVSHGNRFDYWNVWLKTFAVGKLVMGHATCRRWELLEFHATSSHVFSPVFQGSHRSTIACWRQRRPAEQQLPVFLETIRGGGRFLLRERSPEGPSLVYPVLSHTFRNWTDFSHFHHPRTLQASDAVESRYVAASPGELYCSNNLIFLEGTKKKNAVMRYGSTNASKNQPE